METSPAEEPGMSGEDPADPQRGWVCRGWGFPRSPDEVRFLDVAVLLAVALTIWGYVDVSRRGRILAHRVEAHRTDLTVFTEAGAAFFDGRDPYRVTNPRGWFYLYPPLLALLVAPLSALDGPTQVGCWYALSVVVAFGCYDEARRLWRTVIPPDAAACPPTQAYPAPLRWISTCAGLTVTLPTLDCLQRGQVGIVLIYFLMLGFRLVLRGRAWPAWFLGGVVLAFPAVIKLVPVLPVGFVLVQRWSAVLAPGRGPRPTARASAVTLGVVVGVLLFLFAIPAACLGWGKNLDHVRTWYARVAANQNVDRAAGFNIYSSTNQSLANAAHLLAIEVSGARLRGVPAEGRKAAVAARRRVDRVVTRLVWVVRGGVLVLLLASGVATRGSGALGQAAAYGLACSATLVLSPLSWGHYYMFQLPAVICIPLWLASRAGPATTKVLSVLPALLSWGHYTALRWTGPVGLLGLGTTLWVLVVGSWIAWDTVLGAPRRSHDIRRMLSDRRSGPSCTLRSAVPR